MKFLANENFPYTSKNLLEKSGFDIIHIGETSHGISDEAVVELSIKEQRIILTFDRDYGELVFKYGFKPIGVVYFRLKEFMPDLPANILLELLTSAEKSFNNNFVVIDEEKVRYRPIK